MKKQIKNSTQTRVVVERARKKIIYLILFCIMLFLSRDVFAQNNEEPLPPCNAHDNSIFIDLATNPSASYNVNFFISDDFNFNPNPNFTIPAASIPNGLTININGQDVVITPSAFGPFTFQYQADCIINGVTNTVTANVFVYVYNSSNNESCNFTCASQNLVSNGDFEEDIDPVGISNIDAACNWDNIGNGSCDYFKYSGRLGVGGLSVGVPCNFKGLQSDNDEALGKGAYAGIYVNANPVGNLVLPDFTNRYFNEILLNTLNQTLKPNTQYSLSFLVSLAETSNETIIPELQIYFTSQPVAIDPLLPFCIQNASSGTNSILLTQNITPNINGWTQVNISFTTPNSNTIQYMYVGNLNLNQASGVITQAPLPTPHTCSNSIIEQNPTSSLLSYYYLDNFRLIETNNITPSIVVSDCDANFYRTLSVTPTFQSYTWSTGATTPTIITNVAGNYTVTVTNTIGCTATASATVAPCNNPCDNYNPTITFTGNTQFCSGSSTTISTNVSPAGTYTYAWNNGTTTAQNNITTAGTYTVTVTNSAGCTKTAQVTVTQNALPTITFTGNTSFCVGSSTNITAQVTPAGTYTFAWSNGLGNNATATIATAGTYTVIVTNSAGCTKTAQVTVSQNANPTASITQSCVNNIPQLTASGGSTYIWNTGANTANINGVSGQLYTVTVTNTASCTATAQATAQNCNPCANYNPTITFTGNTSFCVGSSTNITAQVTPAGTYTFAWSNGLGNNATATIATAGTYTVIVINSAGCTATAQVTVTQNASPTATITGPSEFCEGTTVTLTANGGDTYTWSNGNNTQNINITAGGNYCVTLTNSSACTATACKQVTMNTAVQFTIGQTALCPQQGVELCVQGSNISNVYWNTGNDNICEIVTVNGNYCVTANTNKQCNSTQCIAVDIPPCLVCDNCSVPSNYTLVSGKLSVLIANGIVSANSPNPLLWLVHGILEIDVPNFNIPDNSDIICDADALIKINPNCNLNIYKAHFYVQSCCARMWKGIRVEHPNYNNAFPNIDYTGNGASIYCDGAFIEDAYKAIEIQSQTNNTIINTRFANNFVGIKYTPDAAFVPVSKRINAYINPIVNCTFETTRNVYTFSNISNAIGDFISKPTNNTIAPRGFAGIYLNCSSGPQIGNVGQGNIFRNIPNGILAYNTKWAAYNNLFVNITENLIASNAQVPKGIGILSSTGGYLQDYTSKDAIIYGFGGNTSSAISFSNVSTAIQTNQSKLNVSGVRTRNVLMGINVTATLSFQNISIQDNYIEASRIALRIASSENSHITVTNNNLRLLPLQSLVTYITGNAGCHTISIEELAPYTTTTNVKQLFNNREITFAKPALALFPNANSAAIHMSGAQGWSITDNLNIRLGVRNVQAGIKLAGCSNNLIENNAIKGLGTGTTQVMMTNSYPMAIRIENSNTNTIHCNQTSETFSGINVAGNSIDNAIKGNQIGSHRIGWHVPANTNCSPQEYNGNRWVGTYSQFAGLNSNPFLIVPQQQIKVTSGVLPLFPNNNWPVNPNIFIANPPFSTQPDYTCPQFLLHQPAELGDIADIPTDTTITDTDMGAVLELNAFDPTFNESLLWMGKKQVFEKLEENPDLQWANAEVASFYTEQQAESIGKLSQAEAYTATALSLLPAEKETIAQAEYEKQPLEASLDSLNLSLSTTADTDSMQSLLNEKQAVQAQIAEKDSTIQQTYTNATLSKAIYIDMGKEEVQQVYDEKYIATAYKEMYSLFLEKLSTDSLYYTDDEISLLQGIAYTCPIIGGKATYMARNILAGLRSTDEYNDYDLCAQAGISMARVAHHSPPMEGQGVGIKVYPNPATDIISIIGNIECTNMVIFDSKGAKQIEISNNAKTINIKQLANGLYYLVLFKNSEVVQKISFHKL